MGINVLSQIFSFRCVPALGLLKSVFLGFALGFLCLILFAAGLFLEKIMPVKECVGIFGVYLITYICLGYCYFHFINLGETARRIRILRELYDARDGLTTKELLERYNAREILQRRLTRLLHNGQLIRKNDAYYIGSPCMLLMAQVLVFFKFILLGKKGEFS
jgi:hypothetical protein